MIDTLLVTIIMEGAVGLAYAVWRKKPVAAILITSGFANLITQPFLWVVLDLFFKHYLIVVFVAEILIWLIESIPLYFVRANRLRFSDALLLSLGMNLSSFAVGWFLPV